MSKHRTTPTLSATPQDKAGAGGLDLLQEQIRVRMEIIRRKDYLILQQLRAELETLPPVPAPHAPPANEG